MISPGRETNRPSSAPPGFDALHRNSLSISVSNGHGIRRDIRGSIKFPRPIPGFKLQNHLTICRQRKVGGKDDATRSRFGDIRRPRFHCFAICYQHAHTYVVGPFASFVEFQRVAHGGDTAARFDEIFRGEGYAVCPSVSDKCEWPGPVRFHFPDAFLVGAQMAVFLCLSSAA